MAKRKKQNVEDKFRSWCLRSLPAYQRKLLRFACLPACAWIEFTEVSDLADAYYNASHFAQDDLPQSWARWLRNRLFPDCDVYHRFTVEEVRRALKKLERRGR